MNRSPCATVLAALLTLAVAIPTVATSRSPIVSIEERGSNLHVSAWPLRATVSKSTGQITSLGRFEGEDVLGKGRTIYFDANGTGPAPSRGKAGYWRMSRPEFKIVRRTEHLLEIAFSRAGDDTFPFDTELHYIFRATDPAIYCYVVYRRGGDAPAGSLIQTRVVLKLRDELFTRYFVNDQTTGKLAKLTDPNAKLVKVADATVMFPDGRIATKYNLADFEANHHVHGLAGPTGGVWVISPTSEYLNGGPTKQNLQVHEDSAILLKMLHSGHFLHDSALRFEQGETWEKLYGPFVIYLNDQADPRAAWADAKDRARKEQQGWPDFWMSHPLFPLLRGTVVGRVVIDGEPASDACVILAAPGQDWQVQGKGYIFWGRTAEDGTFTIRDVRPDKYALYAFVPGCAGELRKDAVVVEPEKSTDLGDVTFMPLTQGGRVWQVGTPDRTAGEFRNGGRPRQFGLWNEYLADFPDDVTFRIGRSSERTDWYYCQPVAQKPDGDWHVPVWRIAFDSPDRPAGKATLMIGIAGATGNPDLAVSVNGREVGRRTLPNDASVYRSATLAGQYQLWTIPFDAGLLTAGENEVRLDIIKSVPTGGEYRPLSLPRAAIMYDFLRLEVAP